MSWILIVRREEIVPNWIGYENLVESGLSVDGCVDFVDVVVVDSRRGSFPDVVGVLA